MNYVFKTLLLASAALIISCGQYDTGLPDYTPTGNVVALLWPDSMVQLRVAITGANLDLIREEERVSSLLYENGVLVDSFALHSTYPIQWQHSYQLKVTIDDKYRVVSEVHRLSDSLHIRFLRREVRENKKDRFFFRVAVPALLPQDSAHYKWNGNRRALPPAGADTIFITSNNDRPRLRLFHYSKDYVLAEREQGKLFPDDDIRPGLVSFTNMEQGVGLISFFHIYNKRP